MEAIEADIELLVVITEGRAVQDTAELYAASQANVRTDGKPKTRIIGPNCPGIITPGVALAGITPATITGTGPIGLVSKSGTLTYQMMHELSEIGISTAICISEIGRAHVITPVTSPNHMHT